MPLGGQAYHFQVFVHFKILTSSCDIKNWEYLITIWSYVERKLRIRILFVNLRLGMTFEVEFFICLLIKLQNEEFESKSSFYNFCERNQNWSVLKVGNLLLIVVNRDVFKMAGELEELRRYFCKTAKLLSAGNGWMIRLFQLISKISGT